MEKKLDMKIYFVRHDENEIDEDLIENEDRQIKLLAHKLKLDKLKVSKIYSTIHSRSIRTAEILSKTLLIPNFREDRFKELNYKTSFFDEDLFFVKMFVDELISNKRDVLLVMSEEISWTIISYLTDLSLKNMRNFTLDFASISMIELTEIEGTLLWRVKFLNDTMHLRIP